MYTMKQLIFVGLFMSMLAALVPATVITSVLIQTTILRGAVLFVGPFVLFSLAFFGLFVRNYRSNMNIDKLQMKGASRRLIFVLVYKEDPVLRERAKTALRALGDEALDKLFGCYLFGRQRFRQKAEETILDICGSDPKSFDYLLKTQSHKGKEGLLSILLKLGQKVPVVDHKVIETMKHEVAKKAEKNLELAQKQIKNAWIAGVISGMMTVVLAVAAMAGHSFLGFKSFYIIEALIAFGLSYGVYRKSRVCAIIMMSYYVAGKALMFMSTKDYSIIFTSLPFAFFFSMGVQGTSAYHEIAKTNGDTGAAV